MLYKKVNNRNTSSVHDFILYKTVFNIIQNIWVKLRKATTLL